MNEQFTTSTTTKYFNVSFIESFSQTVVRSATLLSADDTKTEAIAEFMYDAET